MKTKMVEPLMFAIQDGTVRILHNSGFFSNCTVALHAIVWYFNENRKIPRYVDFSQTFRNFKNANDLERDAYPLFFDLSTANSIPYRDGVNFPLFSLFDYREQDYEALTPFIKRYFTPTAIIKEKSLNLRQKYDLALDRTVAVCYRGTDKWKDTGLGSFDEYIGKVRDILEGAPGLTVLVQTDQTQFLERCQREFDSVIWFRELPTTETERVMHDVVVENKVKWTQAFVAATFVLSKCGHLVLHTGNVARWACLYRRSTENVHQYIKSKGQAAIGRWIG